MLDELVAVPEPEVLAVATVPLAAPPDVAVVNVVPLEDPLAHGGGVKVGTGEHPS